MGKFLVQVAVTMVASILVTYAVRAIDKQIKDNE